MFDCNVCAYHKDPAPVKIEQVIGMNECKDITGSSSFVDIQIISNHRCSIYGFKRTDLVFNWPRCRKYRH